jgi:uncharacterized protein YhfF
MHFELSAEQCRTYLQQAGADPDGGYEVRQIGSDAEMVRLIHGVIVSGEKTMTYSLPWIAERTGLSSPVEGLYLIVVDAGGLPCLLLQLTCVRSLVFGQVSERDLAREGIPMRTLEAWVPLHRIVWNGQLEPFGLQVSAEMPVWAEDFNLVYQSEPST